MRPGTRRPPPGRSPRSRRRCAPAPPGIRGRARAPDAGWGSRWWPSAAARGAGWAARCHAGRCRTGRARHGRVGHWPGGCAETAAVRPGGAPRSWRCSAGSARGRARSPRPARRRRRSGAPCRARSGGRCCGAARSRRR